MAPLGYVNSKMSLLPTLSQPDQSSWTDLTFLLKSALRPDHFLPPRRYFQAAVPQHLLLEWPQKQISLEPSFMTTAEPAMPKLLQRITSVSTRVGRGASFRNNSSLPPHILFGISSPKTPHPHGKTPFSRSAAGIPVLAEGHSWGLTLSP